MPAARLTRRGMRRVQISGAQIGEPEAGRRLGALHYPMGQSGPMRPSRIALVGACIAACLVGVAVGLWPFSIRPDLPVPVTIVIHCSAPIVEASWRAPDPGAGLYRIEGGSMVEGSEPWCADRARPRVAISVGLIFGALALGARGATSHRLRSPRPNA